MIAYKIKEDIGSWSKGRIICPVDNQNVVVGTFSAPQYFISNYTVSKLRQSGDLEEIDLMDEVKSHPHLYKPIKKEVYKLKNN